MTGTEVGMASARRGAQDNSTMGVSQHRLLALLLTAATVFCGNDTSSEDRTMDKAPAPSASIRIKPRYARLYTDPGVELAEANYERVTLDWTVPVAEAAVVCIDCWSWHFSKETLSRINEITERRIAPLLKACREQGLLVIHAPANPVASRHPNFTRMRSDDARPQVAWPDSPAWPPAEFRSKTGAYSQFAKPQEPQDADRVGHRQTGRTFHPLCEPVGDEPVILDGEDLHRFCAERKILHLFFLGFNTNACVMMRDYGLPAMARYGYHAVLLRDCTTGMEIADTLDGLVCTAGTIATIEQFLGYTITSQELVEALQASGSAGRP